MTASNWRDPAPGATGKRATADYTLRGSIYTGAATAWLPVAGLLLAVVAAAVLLLAPRVTDPVSLIWWYAGRQVLAGANPYHEVVGYWPLYYPLPAILLVAPFAMLPFPAFHLVTAGLGGLALGLAATKRPALGPALLSAGFFTSAAVGAWEPLVLAGVALPWCAALVWPAKPSLGLALFAAYPRKVAVAGGLILGLLSLAVLPSWPLDWYASLQRTNHVPPVLKPWGALLLLAWVRYRTPEGRFLGTLALVPHTVDVGATVLLFAVCRSKWEGYGLAVLSYVGALGYALLNDRTSMTLTEGFAAGWPALLVCCYLPALYLVLWNRRSPSTSRQSGGSHSVSVQRSSSQVTV